MNQNDPDLIRSDIERTRNELGQDVDALADKVNPAKVMERRTARVRGAFRSAKERVMGAADDVSGNASNLASDVASNVSEFGHTAVNKAKGNPLAVGLIAFGAGWLISSLIPASEKEKEMAGSVKEAAEPLVHEAGDMAKEMAENLREPAQESMESVKERAREGVDAVKSETGQGS